MQWFRHYRQANHDTKFRTAARRANQSIERTVFVWWSLCEYAAGQNGSLDGYDPELDADFLMCDVTAVTACIDGLKSVGVVDDNCIKNWATRQYQSDTSAERMRRKREKDKQQKQPLARNVTSRDVTCDGCDAPDTESDTESESETESNARARARASLFHEWWQSYPHKVGKAAAEKAYARAIKSGAEHDTLVQGVHRYRASKPPDRAWCNPATWLNQRRWEDEPAPEPERKSYARPRTALEELAEECARRRNGDADAGALSADEECEPYGNHGLRLISSSR